MKESIPMIAFGAILLLSVFIVSAAPGVWIASKMKKEDRDKAGLKL